MTSMRKKAAWFLSVLAFIGLSIAVSVSLFYAYKTTLIVLLAIVKCFGLVALSIMCGGVVFFLLSLLFFVCGAENTLFEMCMKIRKTKREKTPKTTKRETAIWGMLADNTLKIIGKRVRKLKPGNPDALDKLIDFCTEKVSRFSSMLAKGDKVIETAKNFVKCYEERKSTLKGLEHTIVSELKEIKTKDIDPLIRSIRSMKATDLLEVQNQLKKLDSLKKHHEYMGGMVNSTRLLITQAKMAVETVLEELKLKKEREEVLGI